MLIEERNHENHALIAEADSLRRETFLEFIKAGEAHLGGSFSIIELVIALYEKLLKGNDKFILSKSHASFPLCLYLRRKGLNPKLTTHLELDEKNGIYATTGSLGHGLPIAVGMAIARKKLGVSGLIVVLISDGECQEGTTWESLLIASKHKLDNLLLLIDSNKIQALGNIDDILPLHSIEEKIRAFNWDFAEVKDGHSFEELDAVLNSPMLKDLPKAIVVNTIKGKGIPQFENDPSWHAKKIRAKEELIGKKALGII